LVFIEVCTLTHGLTLLCSEDHDLVSPLLHHSFDLSPCCLLLTSRAIEPLRIPGKRIPSWWLVAPLAHPPPGTRAFRDGYKSLLSVDRVRSRATKAYESGVTPDNNTVRKAVRIRIDLLRTALVSSSAFQPVSFLVADG